MPRASFARVDPKESRPARGVRGLVWDRLRRAFRWPCAAGATEVSNASCLVDEAGGVLGPSDGQLILLETHLLRHYVLADFFPVFPQVRSLLEFIEGRATYPTEHALVDEDTESEVICGDTVIGSAHDFGS